MEKFQDYVWKVTFTITFLIFILGFGTVNSTPEAQLLFARFDLMFNRGFSAWSEDFQLRTPVDSPTSSFQQHQDCDWSYKQSWQNDLATTPSFFKPSWPRGYLIVAVILFLSLLVLLSNGFWFMKVGAGFIDREKHYVLSQSK